jgi:PPM family protein phosphatase
MTIAIHYAARSDVGQLREGNEDSAYAGPRLLAVADGMGGHAHGEVASAVAIDTLKPLDQELPSTELLEALERAVRQANQTLHQMVESDAALEGMGTTLTAMLWSGKQLALVHVGDSRAYLLRGGELFQMTHDHTLVQSLVDEQRITPEEAATHPQRSLLLRALDGRGEVEPDLQLREAQVGDRYLLCSDGLSAVVTAETIHETLSSIPDPEQAVRRLIDLANRGGGPDNITCVIADVVELGRRNPPQSAPVVAGAAALPGPPTDPNGQLPQDTPAQRAAALRETKPQPALTVPDAQHGQPHGAPAGPQPVAQTAPLAGPPPVAGAPVPDMAPMARPRPRRRWIWALLSVTTLLAVLVGGGIFALRWANGQYFIGTNGESVIVYRGLAEPVLGITTRKRHKVTTLPLNELPKAEQERVKQNIDAASATEADKIVTNLSQKICKYTYKVGLQNDQVVTTLTPTVDGCQGRVIPANIRADQLPTAPRDALKDLAPFSDRGKAEEYVANLRAITERCAKSPKAAECRGVGPS